MESTPPDLRTVEGDDQSTPEELLETHDTMTNQPDSVEELWNKYCHEGDENAPDRMFYENFVDAITEAIAEAEEDIDLLTEEMARLREDVENAKAEERERIIRSWKKAEQGLNGTTQGALNCIEQFRNALQNNK